jgi:MtN3 and saliva related transmembrane protein
LQHNFSTPEHRDSMADIIGWAAAVILMVTLSRQVYTQWREGSSRGVSSWLFIGQLVSSTGFIIYSLLLHSWVFVATNVLILIVAGVGQWVNTDKQQRPAS